MVNTYTSLVDINLIKKLCYLWMSLSPAKFLLRWNLDVILIHYLLMLKGIVYVLNIILSYEYLCGMQPSNQDSASFFMQTWSYHICLLTCHTICDSSWQFVIFILEMTYFSVNSSVIYLVCAVDQNWTNALYSLITGCRSGAGYGSIIPEAPTCSVTSTNKRFRRKSW